MSLLSIVIMEISSSNRITQVSFPSQKKKGMWQQVINALVRPPKHTYSLSLLGPERFNYNDHEYRRLDISINHQEHNIQLSLFEPEHCVKVVVLYLHGNSSSRVEAFTLIEYLPQGYSLASFDFLGCGNSKEQYISLGVRESKQISTVVSYLETNGYEVVLWGRSMGAASCLKYGGTNITVVDSPFASLKKVCKDTLKNKKPEYVPGCLVQCLFPCVFAKLRRDIRSTADFDVNQLEILPYVKRMDQKKTVIFMSGTDDTLINHKHSQKLFEAFRGEHKKIYMFPGGHNNKRPRETMVEIFQIIEERVSSHRHQITEHIASQHIEMDARGSRRPGEETQATT